MTESEFSQLKHPVQDAVRRHASGSDHAMEGCMDVTHGVERFAAKDLASLKTDMLQSGVDSFQAAELVTNFLSGRGYGISTDEARVVASKIDGAACTLEQMETELALVARVA